MMVYVKTRDGQEEHFWTNEAIEHINLYCRQNNLEITRMVKDGSKRARFEQVVRQLEAYGCGYSMNLFPKISRIEIKDKFGKVFETVEVKAHTVVIDGTDEMPLRNYLGY